MFRPTATAAVLGWLACALAPALAQTPALPASTARPASAAATDPPAREPIDDSPSSSPPAAEHRPASAPRIPTQYSRLATFRIPYGFDQHSVEGFEVLLYVSANRGDRWSLYARQAPTDRMFAFRAADDGEYWFTSLTVPAGKQPRDFSRLTPQLRVVVDTKLPQVKLNATVTPSGKVQVAWEASDPHLDPQSLRLEVQWPGNRQWQVVAMETGDERTRSAPLRGDTELQPVAGADAVNIRLTARDHAQNVGVQARSLALSPPRNQARGQAGAWSLSRVPPDPFAIHGTPPFSGFQPPPTATATPATAVPANSRTSPPPGTPPPNSTDLGTDDPAGRSIAWPSDNNESSPPPNHTAFGAGSPAAPAPRADAAQRPPGSLPATAGSGSAAAGSDRAAARATIRDDAWHGAASDDHAVSITEATASVADQSLRDPTAEELARRPLLPNGERPQMTRSSRFNLAYSIDAVGPAGVEKVELWITRNGGRDWNLWGIDEDRESPFLVEVPDEGIFGFRVVIVGKNGLASATPRAGDLADLWVGVDTTKPRAEITTAAYGTGLHAGQLDIRWQAADDHLALRPITLQFSDTPDGNWTTIASGLPNTGQYFWRVDSRVPTQFYLRLEARDEAGNVAVHQLDEPIASAGLIPKGTIRGVSPLPQ